MANELNDGPRQRNARRKWFWILAVMLIVVVPVIVILMQGHHRLVLTPEARALVGTWEVIVPDEQQTITFRDDGISTTDTGAAFTWWIDYSGRLNISDASQPFWTNLSRWIAGSESDVNEYDYEISPDGHLLLRTETMTEAMEFRRLDPNLQESTE